MALHRSVPTMSLFLDIGQGPGLAGSSGVRPYLPPLLAGALARGDVGRRLQRHRLLVPREALVARADVRACRGLLRARAQAAGARDTRRRLSARFGVLGVVFGALLFAGSLADTGHTSWPGLIAGVACAALSASRPSPGCCARTRRRLESWAVAMLTAYCGPVLACPRRPRDPDPADLVRRARGLRAARARRAGARAARSTKAFASFGR